MPICLICDDSGLQNSDSTNPEFCYCSAGKQGKRQWEAGRREGKQGKNMPASFIDIANLEQVNASVDAMRVSLLGSGGTELGGPTKHPAVQLLYQVAHLGHEISAGEATHLYELAKALEGFLSGIGRTTKR